MGFCNAGTAACGQGIRGERASLGRSARQSCQLGREMDPVATTMILIAGLLLVGALGEFVFARTGVPDVVWLVAAGILAGPVFGSSRRPRSHRASPFSAGSR